MTQKFQQRKTRRGWETAGRWAFKSAGAVLATGMAVSAGAQTLVASNDQPAIAAGSDPAISPAEASAKHVFKIPAGPLSKVLDAYQEATGLHVQLKFTAEDIADFQSAGLQGSFTDAAALHLLLDKTGLSFSFGDGNVVEIAVRNSESVEVNAPVTSVAMQQFTESLLDTAQTVNVVPQYIMQEQGATELRDTLRNVPGISLAAGEGGSQGDTLTIRGFNARNDIFLDGIRDFGSYYRDSFDFESVEVLEGPASVEFGRGSTGGVVNQESKQPDLRPFAHATLQLGTNQMRRGTADINHPLHGLGDGSAFRLNVAASQNMFAGRQISEVRRFGLAPSFEFGMNTPTRYTVQYLHESENTTPDYGLPYFGPAVVPVDHSTYYGFASENYLKTNPDIVTGKVEHDFGSHMTVRNILRWANYPRDVRITEPQINTTAALTNPTVINGPLSAKCDPTLVNSATVSACYPLNTPLSQVQVLRNQLTSRSTEDMLWDQASLTAHFAVLNVPNDVLIIVEGGRERSDPDRNSYKGLFAPAINPNPYDAFAPTQVYPGVRTYVNTQSYGIGFLDTVKLREWLLVSGGVRFDYFNTLSYAAANPLAIPATTAFNVSRLDKQPTYRAAITVKPKPQGSFYFDYGTSFNPSAESLSLSANNAAFAPEENTTYELGGKWEFLHGRLNLNGSVFQTEKDNAHETDPTNSNNTKVVGTYLVKGTQFGMLGHLPHDFDLILGYAYLDGYLKNSVLNASPFNAINNALKALNDPRAGTAPFFISPNGYPIANVPRNSGNFWITHRLFKGFVGGFGGNYVSARRASSGALIAVYNTSAPITNLSTVPLVPKAIPGYEVFNLMLKKSISRNLDFQVNVNNIANKFYIDQPHPNHLVPGEGVNAQFGFNYKF